MNYPSNSHNNKSDDSSKPPKKVEKVIEGEAVTRKQPLGRKILETFSGDDFGTVGNYILFEVLLPSAKNMIAEAIKEGSYRLLFGEAGRRITSGAARNRTNYNRVFTVRNDNREQRQRPVQESRGGFEEIILDNRVDADNILERLTDLINDYDVATVSDLYSMVGKTADYTYDKWGWTDLRGSEVRHIREGYLIDIPRPRPID